MRNRDIKGEKRVCGKGNTVRGDGAVGFKIRAVALGVNSGIRSAAADDLDGVFANSRKRRFQSFRNRNILFLNLPAVVARSVIHKAQGDISHSLLSS